MRIIATDNTSVYTCATSQYPQTYLKVSLAHDQLTHHRFTTGHVGIKLDPASTHLSRPRDRQTRMMGTRQRQREEGAWPTNDWDDHATPGFEKTPFHHHRLQRL